MKWDLLHIQRTCKGKLTAQAEALALNIPLASWHKYRAVCVKLGVLDALASAGEYQSVYLGDGRRMVVGMGGQLTLSKPLALIGAVAGTPIRVTADVEQQRVLIQVQTETEESEAE